MEKFFPALQKCPLFGDLERAEIEELLKSTAANTVAYPPDSVIALEGENCSSLGILLAGKIEIQKTSPSGKTITIAQFHPGNIFGEAIIFARQHHYPGTVIACTEIKILYIHRDKVISLCRQYPGILQNFMALLSDRILMLNKKIKELSLGTIREKICHFLLEEYQKQKKLTIKLNFSRETMAELMGIQRPSLSRELSKMREEGLISLQKGRIEILNLSRLEEILY